MKKQQEERTTDRTYIVRVVLQAWYNNTCTELQPDVKPKNSTSIKSGQATPNNQAARLTMEKYLTACRKTFEQLNQIPAALAATINDEMKKAILHQASNGQNVINWQTLMPLIAAQPAYNPKALKTKSEALVSTIMGHYVLLPAAQRNAVAAEYIAHVKMEAYSRIFTRPISKRKEKTGQVLSPQLAAYELLKPFTMRRSASPYFEWLKEEDKTTIVRQHMVLFKDNVLELLRKTVYILTEDDLTTGGTTIALFERNTAAPQNMLVVSLLPSPDNGAMSNVVSLLPNSYNGTMVNEAYCATLLHGKSLSGACEQAICYAVDFTPEALAVIQVFLSNLQNSCNQPNEKTIEQL